jgi:hypothetical protein
MLADLVRASITRQSSMNPRIHIRLMSDFRLSRIYDPPH